MLGTYIRVYYSLGTDVAVFQCLINRYVLGIVCIDLTFHPFVCFSLSRNRQVVSKLHNYLLRAFTPVEFGSIAVSAGGLIPEELSDIQSISKISDMERNQHIYTYLSRSESLAIYNKFKVLLLQNNKCVLAKITKKEKEVVDDLTSVSIFLQNGLAHEKCAMHVPRMCPECALHVPSIAIWCVFPTT